MPIYSDDAVAPTILGLVREARREVIIVSPYLRLWPHAQQALEIAAKNKVGITFYVRTDQDDDRVDDDLFWLQGLGAKLYVVDKLHAKIYMNERAVVLSSMNFTVKSAQASREVAIPVEDEVSIRQTREYVARSLAPLAKRIQIDAIREEPRTSYGIGGGKCIRCLRPIGLDPLHPLCDSCYQAWSYYGNEDYVEKGCHSCGRAAAVSYAKPLCSTCFSRANRY